MARLLFIPSLVFTLLITTVIGVIHARPYDGSGLRAFLSPPQNCSPPCFMGIRLGRMTTGQAIEWLDQHPWVDHVILSERFGATQRGFVGWRWNGQQPAWINSDDLASLWISNQAVRFVRFQTRVSFGDIWLLLGNPPLGRFHREGDFIVLAAAYPDASFLAQVVTRCPLRPTQFWTQAVQVQFYDGLTSAFDRYDLTGWFDRVAC